MSTVLQPNTIRMRTAACRTRLMLWRSHARMWCLRRNAESRGLAIRCGTGRPDSTQSRGLHVLLNTIDCRRRPCSLALSGGEWCNRCRAAFRSSKRIGNCCWRCSFPRWGRRSIAHAVKHMSLLSQESVAVNNDTRRRRIPGTWSVTL